MAMPLGRHLHNASTGAHIGLSSSCYGDCHVSHLSVEGCGRQEAQERQSRVNHEWAGKLSIPSSKTRYCRTLTQRRVVALRGRHARRNTTRKSSLRGATSRLEATRRSQLSRTGKSFRLEREKGGRSARPIRSRASPRRDPLGE